MEHTLRARMGRLADSGIALQDRRWPKARHCTTPQLFMVRFNRGTDGGPRLFDFAVEDITEHATAREALCVSAHDEAHHALMPSNIFRDERLPTGRYGN